MSADDDDWAEDMSPAAIAARQQALSGGAIKKITAGDDEEEDPLEDFAAFINDNPEASALDLLQEVARLDVREDMAIVVYMQVFFDKTFSSKLISTHADTLKAFMKNEKCQKGLLGGFERLVGEIFPAELMAKVPVLLKAFYDEDIVDEEVILAWGEKPSKKYVEKSVSKEVRAKAKPFLDWLKTADEEESEEDDDE